MDMRSLPRPGFGTWQLTDADACVSCVRHAIETGYRHIDTAVNYRNEKSVGRGIAEAPVDRDELFIATKIPTGSLGGAEVTQTADESLDRLGIDRIDLLYVHWPMRTYDAAETLPAMAALVDDGKVDALGLSNFTPMLLDEAMDLAGDVIIAHQYEKHPYLPNREVHRASTAHGLYSVAYSPLARGHVLDEETIVSIASDRGITPAQVVLAWLHHDDDVVAIPKSSSHARIEENFAAGTHTLTDDEVARIDAIEHRERLVDPDGAPWNR